MTDVATPITGPRQRSFRGWWVLSGLFLVYAASNGILVHSLPLLYPELIDTFGWTEAQVTLPATILLVVSAITSPPVGYLLDKYSARLLLGLGAAGATAGLTLHAGITELWHMVVAYVVIALALSLSGVVANMFVLSRWFRKLHGRAAGILLMASSLGGVLFPLVVGFCLQQGGWRIALFVLAALAAGLMLPAVLFLVRDRPEQDGFGHDGVALHEIDDGSSRDNRPAGISLAQALRNRTFYLLAIGTATVWFCILALLQHQSIHLGRDLGVPSARLSVIFSVFFLSSMGGKLLFGWLGDRFRKERVMISSIVLLGIGLILLRSANADNSTSLYLYAVIAGMGFSGAFTAIQVLLAHVFAGPSFGKILALLVLIDTLSGALGTRVVATMRGASGSYLPAIDMMIGLCLGACACILLINWNRPAQTLERVA